MYLRGQQLLNPESGRCFRSDDTCTPIIYSSLVALITEHSLGEQLIKNQIGTKNSQFYLYFVMKLHVVVQFFESHPLTIILIKR